MCARDQFLNRAGFSGVRNSLVRLNYITLVVTRLLSRICRYQATEAYARASFLEVHFIAPKYRIDGA